MIFFGHKCLCIYKQQSKEPTYINVERWIVDLPRGLPSVGDSCALQMTSPDGHTTFVYRFINEVHRSEWVFELAKFNKTIPERDEMGRDMIHKWVAHYVDAIFSLAEKNAKKGKF